MKYAIKTLVITALILSVFSCGHKDSLKLTDGEWVLSSMQNPNGVEETIATNRPTLLFSDSTSQFSGYGGCNNFFGDYTVNNKSLSIDTKGITQALCLDMSVEEQMLAMLRNVQSYKISGDQLILYGSENAELARFDRNY